MNCTECDTGYFPSTTTACSACNTAINNCVTCTPDYSGSATCLTCAEKYYTADGTQCTACTQIDASCFFCNNAGECTQCLFGYYVDSVTHLCVQQPACTVSNCARCSNVDGSVCLTCNQYFVLSADSSTCAPPTSCPNGKVFDGTTCSCAKGKYDTGSLCADCSSNCLSCSSGSVCSICTAGFFIDSGSCTVCGNNCKQCSDASTCTICTAGFSSVDGACV